MHLYHLLVSFQFAYEYCCNMGNQSEAMDGRLYVQVQ